MYLEDIDMSRWTDYTPFILGPCLTVWTFLILPLCLSTYDFSKYDFGMLKLRLFDTAL